MYRYAILDFSRCIFLEKRCQWSVFLVFYFMYSQTLQLTTCTRLAHISSPHYTSLFICIHYGLSRYWLWIMFSLSPFFLQFSKPRYSFVTYYMDICVSVCVYLYINIFFCIFTCRSTHLLFYGASRLIGFFFLVFRWQSMQETFYRPTRINIKLWKNMQYL